MEFTFGPRHRIVTRSARFPWFRVAASVSVGVVLGFMLLTACGIAHADVRDDKLRAAIAMEPPCTQLSLVAYAIAVNRDRGTPAARAVPTVSPMTPERILPYVRPLTAWIYSGNMNTLTAENIRLHYLTTCGSTL